MYVFSPGRRAWEPQERVGSAPRPGLHAPERAAQPPTWVGNPRAAASGCGRSGVRPGGPAGSSGERCTGAIPAEAGVHGCHTCITAPAPPPQPPPPALAQRAARRRRHTEHQGREAPASSIQWDQILTRFLPGLSIKAFAAGSSSLLNLLLIGDGVFGIAGWEGDPAGPQAPWICRAIDVKLLIPRVSSFIPQ